VGVLLISAELDEILSLSDRIIVLYKGTIVGEVEGAHASREQIGLWMMGTQAVKA
jgi:general nucleoside transport system ATP-binding protein